MKIPVLPISYEDALPLFEAMRGRVSSFLALAALVLVVIDHIGQDR